MIHFPVPVSPVPLGIFTDYLPAFTGFLPIPANLLYTRRISGYTFESTNQNKHIKKYRS